MNFYAFQIRDSKMQRKYKSELILKEITKFELSHKNIFFKMSWLSKC